MSDTYIIPRKPKSFIDDYAEEVLALYAEGAGAPEIIQVMQFPITARTLQRWLKAKGIIRTRIDALKLSEPRRIATIQNSWKDYKALYTRKALSTSKRYRIMTRDNFRCKYCGIPASAGAWLEIDHIKPIHEGGTNDDSNLQTLCKDCNSGKYHLNMGHK